MFGLSVFPNYIAPFIFLGLVFSIVRGIQNGIRWKKNLALMPMVLLFVWYAVGLIWTEDAGNGSTMMERKLSLIIFPFLFLFRGTDSYRNKTIFMWSFGLGAFVESLLSFGKAFSCYTQGGNRDCFFSSYFSYQLHPSYHALYDVMVIAILLYVLIAMYSELPTIQKVIFVSGIFYFSFIVVLLASKSGLICLLLVFFLAAWFWAWKRNKLKRALIGFAAGLLLFGGMVSFSEVASQRFKSAFAIYFLDQTELFNQYKHTTESTAVRRMIWIVGTEKTKEHLWIGHGTGDVTNVLASAYEKHQMTGALTQKLNAHNQFLQVILGSGLIGLFLLLSIFIFPMVLAWKRNNYLFLVFTGLVIVNLLFESMFEVQAGIVFISLFHCFLFVNYGGQR
jgi:O-antigen ligase